MRVYNPVGGGGNPGTFTFVTATGDITPSVTFGAFSYGALSYSDTNNVFVGQTSVNSYLQMVLQNTNAGSAAATSFVASNNQSTATTNYVELGINSSGFTGTGSFSAAGYGYLATATTDLVIGTYGANGIHFVVNNGATDAMAISSAGVVTIAGNPVSALGSVSGVFGTGCDGALAISSGTTTLTRDWHASSVTMTGTGKLALNGFKLYCTGTLDISAAAAGAISANGPAANNASGATGGAAKDSPHGSTPWGNYSLAVGGSGNTTTGTNPSQGASTAAYAMSGAGGAGANGGAGVSAGGTGLTGQTIASGGGIVVGTNPSFMISPNYSTPYPNALFTGLFGGPGAQGGGDAVNAGGGGGGAGPPGGPCVIFARYINRGGSTPANCITSNGANGGTGANGVAGTAGGGGGGGGGSGGLVFILCESLLGSTATNAIQAAGGTGGTGGNSPSTNKGGNGGTGGGSGAVVIQVLSTPSISITQSFTAGTAGSTTSTVTGAAGGAGAALQVNL